jgi:hypothetical protein
MADVEQAPRPRLRPTSTARRPSSTRPGARAAAPALEGPAPPARSNPRRSHRAGGLTEKADDLENRDRTAAAFNDRQRLIVSLDAIDDVPRSSLHYETSSSRC